MFGKNRGLLGTVFSGLSGMVIFVILVYLANIIVPYVNNYTYWKFVYFINVNVALILLISIVSFLGDLVYLLNFPFDVPAPIFKTVSAMMGISFVFNLISFIDLLLKIHIYNILKPFEDTIYLIVIIVFLVLGYAMVINKKRREDREIGKIKEIKKSLEVKEAISEIEWEDIGKEIKLAVYNLVSTIKVGLENLEKKNNRKNKKRR